jgi:O-antigen/teichoic acid export membrane protein
MDGESAPSGAPLQAGIRAYHGPTLAQHPPASRAPYGTEEPETTSRVTASEPIAAPAPAAETRGARGRLLAHLRTPLHRDGYALAASSAFTAAAGLVYWIIAAKTYDPRAVGINSALISSMVFLAGIAGLNLPNIVVRFLPEAGPRTGRMIALAYAATGLLAVVVAAVFIVGVGAWSPRLSFLRADGALAVWFVVSTVAWSLFTVQDSVLTALGRAVWVPIENTAFAVGKVALLAGLAGLAPVYGIFVSWTVGMLAAVVVVNALVFLRLTRRAAAEPAGAPIGLRDRAFRRYFAADYVCSVAWVSACSLMPVLVTAAAGPTTNAYYALAWAISLPLYALVLAITMALVVHGARDPADLPALLRKATRQAALVLVPVVAFVVGLAPELLSLFGGAYAHRSAGVLRLLAAGALPYLAISLVVSAARVRRRMGPAAVALVAQAVLALGLVTPLLHALGVVGAGLAWLSSLVVVAVVFVGSQVPGLRAARR